MKTGEMGENDFDQGFLDFDLLSSPLKSSLTRSAIDVYSGCSSRYFFTCSYRGSGIAICRYPFVMLNTWYKFISKHIMNIFTIYSKKVYYVSSVFTIYGKRRESNGSL